MNNKAIAWESLGRILLIIVMLVVAIVILALIAAKSFNIVGGLG